MICPEVQYPHWKASVVDERLLQRVQATVALGDPFDGA